jgi:hypothetical protein
MNISLEDLIDLIFGVLMPLSTIFQLYHGNQFLVVEYPERTTDHGQATGKLYHLWLRVKCTQSLSKYTIALHHLCRKFLA